MTRRLSHLGKELQSRLKVFFDTAPGPNATPLEICQAVLDDVERKVQPLGRGRRVFPYSRLVVRLFQADADRAGLEAAFAGMGERVLERLRELRCDAPSAIDVRVAVLKKAPAGWPADRLFAVDYQGDADVPASQSAVTPPALRVTVLKGASTEETYTFTEPQVSIGRTADPTDALGRVRRNRVAFLDTVDGITETVGRAHARLCRDAKSGEYALFDDGSSNGTSIVRDGATIAVPPRDPRGVRVRSGDEIQVGRAIIRVEFS